MTPQLPSHPDTGDDPLAGPAETPIGIGRGRRVWGIAIAVALVTLFIVLHLSGVLGPGEH